MRINILFQFKVLFLCFLVSCPVLDVYPQDVDTLLFKVAEMYKELQSFQFEGRTETRVRRGRQTQSNEYYVRLAQEVPDNYRVELGGERARILVTNDSTTLAFHPLTQQYIERPEPLEHVSQRADFPDIVRMYARLDELAEQARMIDIDTVYTVNGARHMAYYVEVIPKKTPQTQGQTITFQFIIDHETLAILKERKSSYIPNTPQGAISITQTTEYDVARVSGDIADSLFVFTPPSEAVRVSKINDFPNLPVSLHGQKVSPFTLQMARNDQAKSIADFSGKVVVLNFWATWCAPCRAEMGALNKYYHQWRSHGLEVVAINLEEQREVVMPYIEDEGLDIPVLLDQFGVVTRQMEVNELPTTFILDRQGIIRHHLIGARTEADFERYLSPFFDGNGH